MRRMVIMCLKKRVNLFYLLLLIFLSLTETDLVNAEKSLIAAGNIDLNTTRSEPDPKAEYSPKTHFQIHGKEEEAGLNICENDFDTMSAVDDDMVLFFGKHMYSRALNRIMLIRDAYKKLPENLTKIDAYYLNPKGNEYFFIRGNVYVFRKGSFLQASSGDLRKFILTPKINRVTAILQDVGKIIIVSDEYYWTANEQLQNCSGPFLVQDLFGQYLPITSTFMDLDGVTYMSMGGKYWPFDWKTHKLALDKGHSVEDLICSFRDGNLRRPKCCGPYSPKAHFQIHGKEEVAGLNVCMKDFDTISAVDDDMVLFFGQDMYSRGLNKFVRIRDAYKELPANLTRIDAYYFDLKGYEYFFVGRDVYVFYEGSFVKDTSKRLSNNPLIMEFSRASAVLKRDGEIFIICVDYYYTVDEQFTITSGVQAIANLIGESNLISSAFTDSNGVTYIIVGREYWRLDWKTHQLVIERHSIEDLICSFCKGNVHQPKCCVPFPQVHFQIHGKEEVAGLNICTMPYSTISAVGDDMVLFFGKHMYSFKSFKQDHAHTRCL